MTGDDDAPTLGEVRRGLERVETALTDFTRIINDKLDTFESKLVRTDRFDFEMSRIQERFEHNERRIVERFEQNDQQINANFRAVNDDVDRLSRALDAAQSTFTRAMATRRERWSLLIRNVVLPATATFCAGVGLTVLTLALDGKL